MISVEPGLAAAARGDIPAAESPVVGVAISPDGARAVVLLLIDPAGDGHPYQVVCERDAAGAWQGGMGANGWGWSSTGGDSEDAGVLTWWERAPDGAEAAIVRVGDRLVEAPVAAGHALHAEWDVPLDDADWPELVLFA